MTLTEQLQRGLACFNQATGHLAIAARTPSGFSEAAVFLSPPFHEVPFVLLNLLQDDYSLRVCPYTVNADNSFVDAPLLVVKWLPATTEDVPRRVQPDARAAIAAALQHVPQPSILVDGEHEVWAGWRLERPLSDEAEASAVMTALAAKLQAEAVPFARPPYACTLPLAGRVRNWNVQQPDFIRILEADPTRKYAVAQLIEERTDERDSRENSRRPRSSAGARGARPAAAG